MTPKEFTHFIAMKLRECGNHEEKRALIDSYMDALEAGLKTVGITVVKSHIDNPLDHLKQIIKQQIQKDVDDTEGIKTDDSGDEKVVGDAVVVVSRHSGAYMHDFETKEQLSSNGLPPKVDFTGIPAIVISEKENYEFNCGHCDEIHVSDLIIYIPSLGKKFHIHSRFVKLL